MVQESFAVDQELEEAMRAGWIPCLDWSNSLWECAVGLCLALTTSST